MDAFFKPKRIAVIGASRHKEKVGHVIFKNVKDKAIPVNPNARKILGKKCYPSILDVPGKIDLAVIAVKAELVPKVLEEAGKKGVKAAIVVSAGFSEVGNEELEEKVVGIAKKYGLRLLGPNCLGVITPVNNISFFEGKFRKGKISIISQSGALGVAILDILLKEGIGIHSFISVGNAADVSISELIEYLERKKDVEAIGIYVESVRDGNAFFKALKKAKKPIVILKGGKTKIGMETAKSHTAAIATSGKIYKGICLQTGCIWTESLKEFMLTLRLATRRVGKRVVVVSNAGGLAVLLADSLSKYGFELVKLDKALMELDKVLPKSWNRRNPIDIVGDAPPERYRKTLEIVSRRLKFDVCIVALTPQAMSMPYETAKLLKRYNVITLFVGGKKVEKAIRLLNSFTVNFDDPEMLARCLAKVYKCVYGK